MNFEKVKITQHSIDRFMVRYLGKKKSPRLYPDQYYKDLITAYLKNSIQIEIPIQDQVRKALKYADDPARYFLNRNERILFVIVGEETLVTLHYPYDDSKQYEKGRRGVVFKRNRRKRRRS